MTYHGTATSFYRRNTQFVFLQVNKINFAFRTLGKAKTLEIGNWTPPVLLIEMRGNRVYCTNHNNVECDLEDCFRIRYAVCFWRSCRD